CFLASNQRPQLIIGSYAGLTQAVNSAGNHANDWKSAVEQATVEIEMTLSPSPKIQSVGEKKSPKIVKDSVVRTADRRTPIAFRRALGQMIGRVTEFRPRHAYSAPK